MTLFNVGGSVPGTGLGEVKQAPAARNTAQLTIKRVIPTAIVAGTASGAARSSASPACL